MDEPDVLRIITELLINLDLITKDQYVDLVKEKIRRRIEPTVTELVDNKLIAQPIN